MSANSPGFSSPMPIPGATGGSEGSGDLHRAAAALLVRQYMGDHISDASPRSAGSTFRRRKSSRPGSVDNLAQYIVEDEAASKIQKHFRRFQSDQNLRRRSFGKFGKEAMDLIRRYTEAAGKLEEETFASKARLVLHFDINKTIIMLDKAQDGDVDFILNVLLSDCAWGRLDPGPVWMPVGRLATDRPANDPQLMTYRSYLDSFMLPFDEGQSPEVQRRNTKIKAKRQALKRTFTCPGQPGEMFRGIFEKLRSALQLPRDHPKTSNFFASGDFHILPSFFNLLIHLQNQKRDFTILFRSFGNDFPGVIEEMNMFCTGQHPRYPGVRMDGTDGKTDLRLDKKDSLGVYHRSTTKADGSALLVGADQALQGGDVSPEQLEDTAEAGQSLLLTRFSDIHSYYMDIARTENRAFAIRDYYPFWKSRNERSHAGKLFFLDPKDKDTLKIFFDDNIGHTAAHIVDVRDIHTGRSMPFQGVVGKHILKVEPLNAILDPHYFVRAVHECVMAWMKAGLKGRDSFTDNEGIPRELYSRGSAEGAVNVAYASRRARDLWSTLQTKLIAFVRLKKALQDS